MSAADTPLDRFAQRDRPDVGREFNELGKAAHVPGQTLRQRRMEKPLQRAVEARERQPKIVQQGRGRRALRQQLPRQITHQTDRVAAARGLDAADVRARLGRKHARHRQRRVLLGQVAQHADLAVRRFGAGVEIDDLEDVLALIGGAQMEIAVALPGQRANRARKTIDVARDPLGFRRRKDRRRGPQSQQACALELLENVIRRGHLEFTRALRH